MQLLTILGSSGESYLLPLSILILSGIPLVVTKELILIPLEASPLRLL